MNAHSTSHIIASCTYCKLQFGTELQSFFSLNTDKRRLRVQAEHFRPVLYGGGDEKDNIVLACQICNQNKGVLLFRTIDEASDFLLKQMYRQGWFIQERGDTESHRVGLKE